MRLYLFLPIFLPLFLTACGLPPGVLKYRAESTPVAGDYPGQEAVVLEDYHNSNFFWHVDGYGYFKTVQREVIKVFSHPENHSNRYIFLGKGDDLERLDGYVLTPDGATRKLESRHIFDQKGVGDQVILHSEAHIKKMTFPGVVPGSIIFLETQTTRAAGLAFHDWAVQREIPVRKATYILNAPLKLFISKQEGGHGWNWRYVTYNGGETDPVRRQIRGSVVSYDWTFLDVPALKNEPHMPARDYFALKLSFAPPDFKTWLELGDLYQTRFFNPKFKISPLIRRLSDSLRAAHAQDGEFVQAALETVRALRYVAVSIGASGLEPDAPETVYRNRYGDCKGKTALLLALLQSQGILSWPALILTRNAGAPDPDFASFHFNHMIAAVRISPADTLWIDPTEDYASLGRLPAECAGRDALLLSKGGSRLVRTPAYSSRDNVVQAVTRVVFPANRDTAHYACSLQLTGELRRRALYRIRNEPDGAAKLATGFLYSNAMGAYLRSPRLEPKGDTLGLTFQVHYPVDRGNPQFPESPLSLIALDGFISVPSRRHPLDMDFPFEVSEEIGLQVPTGMRPPLTAALEKENYVLKMSRTPDSTASGVWAKKRFSLLSDLVAAEDYPGFRADLETWQRHNSRYITLASDPVAGKPPPRSSQPLKH